MTTTHEDGPTFSLDPTERRTAMAPDLSRRWRGAPFVPRLGLAAATVVVAACLAGMGYVAYTMSGVSAAKRAIVIGPLADMPEIRDGVPAVRSATVLPAVRTTAVSTAGRAPPRSAPEAEAANARAMALTIAAAELRPGFSGRPEEPPAPLVTRTAEPKPAPAAASAIVFAPPTAVAIPPAAPAPPPVEDRPGSTAALPKPDPVPSAQATAPIDARRPASAPPVAAAAPEAPAPVVDARAPQPAPASASPPPAAATPIEAAPTETVASALPAAAPLPPARPSEVVAAPRPSEPARVGAVFRPVPGPKPAPKPAQVADQAPPPATRPAPAAAEDRAEILGVPLPSFLPTGRDIRDAANSIADAVTGRF